MRGREQGPTVVITGGLHGNEPAGVSAAAAVLAELDSVRHALRGNVVALSGNRAGLERGARFVSRDLNRNWHAKSLERLGAASLHELRGEDREQRELHDAFLALEREASSVVVLDLHTTSGPSEPFVCVADTSGSREIASALPVAAVVGLERKIDGAMVSWCAARGHVALSFEAGQHADPVARRRHVAAIWTVLVAVGAVDLPNVPGRETHRPALLPSGGRARVVEVRHRHVVRAGDDFEMLGRFESFDPIEAGQIVARDRRGPVRAPESGLMLMPRYQAQGEDGFFVAREVIALSRNVS
ncbi:MAG TPA: succinylglutamate desuccinylase/aspartoacylase family protein [Labilithrix sp.]|nr:succinylglutamate desuccinylase/aspartoacylase family protein [Labilithrix sp.]